MYVAVTQIAYYGLASPAKVDMAEVEEGERDTSVIPHTIALIQL